MNKSDGKSFHTWGNRRANYSFEKFGVRSSLVLENNPTIKVLVLGDSFTFGSLLNSGDTYISLLAKSYPHIAFLNAAVVGWGASDYTAYMETYCDKIKPDITLVIMNADDIGRMLRSKLYTYNSKTDLVIRSKYEQNTRDQIKKLLNSVSLYSYLIENSHLMQLMRSSYIGSVVSTNKIKGQYNPYPSSFGLMEIKSIDYSNNFSASLFRYLKNISTECGTELRIIYTGVQEKNHLGTYPTLEFIEYAQKLDFFKNLEVSFIDLSDTLFLNEYRNNLEIYTIEHEGHPNELGSKLIFNAINQSGILLNKLQ